MIKLSLIALAFVMGSLAYEPTYAQTCTSKETVIETFMNAPPVHPDVDIHLYQGNTVPPLLEALKAIGMPQDTVADEVVTLDQPETTGAGIFVFNKNCLVAGAVVPDGLLAAAIEAGVGQQM